MDKRERFSKLARAYYSRQDIQKAIFDFCQNRETIPRYFEGFGKRPDTLGFPTDVIQQVKRNASSFHCSQEIWSDPLDISTELTPEQLDELRDGWDLVIDIDCKWFDFSKRAAQAIIESLERHGVKNIGIKFSGGKGFHIIIPWKAFPKQARDGQTKDMFPDLPRKIASYLRARSEKIMESKLPEDFHTQFKNVNIKKGVKCRNCSEIAEKVKIVNFICPLCKREEIKKFTTTSSKSYKCPECNREFKIKDSKEVSECNKCGINSEKNPENFSQISEIDLFELMGLDIILVSPRHLFRTPYSLHEKTGLASVVIDKKDLEKFHPKLADPLRITVKDFYPHAEPDEAKELLMSALDWHEEHTKEPKKVKKEYQKINIDKSQIVYPPCISNILKGMQDGKKRALFVLINYFRSLGLNLDEIEEKVEDWNDKNKPKLKQGYIHSQINWHRRQKAMLPPNCSKVHYKSIRICTPNTFCKMVKNPVNYSVRKSGRKKQQQ